MESLAMKRESVPHDGDQLRMNLVLMLVVVLYSPKVNKGSTFRAGIEPRKAASLTRLSLSNSINMTACFGFKCRRNVSRTYGIRAIMTDRDCEASAGELGISESTRCRGHVLHVTDPDAWR
jgi:hypothetical protein